MCTRSKQANIILVILFFIIFIILSLVAFSVFEVPNEELLKEGECRKNEFKCMTNETYPEQVCISKEKVCDEFRDCPLEDDEDDEKCDFSSSLDFFIGKYDDESKKMNETLNITYITHNSTITDDPFETTTFETIVDDSNSTDSPFETLTSTMKPVLNKSPKLPAHCRPKSSCDFLHSLVVCCKNQKIQYMPAKLEPTIKVLQMDKNNFTFLNGNSFKNLSYLQTVSFEGNQIEKIEYDAFYSIPNLRRLFLNHNRLTSLPEKLFRNLTEIRFLVFSTNRISRLSLSMFSNLDHLFHLDLSSNNIKLNDQEFPYLPSLSFLHLDNNKIESINKNIFRNLPRLSSLSLTNNKIVSISPHAFAQNLELAHLSLSKNQLDDSQMSSQLFKPLSNLKTLNLSHNLFNNLPLDMFYYNLELFELSLDGLPIYNVSKKHFERLKKLNSIHFPHFRYCMFIPAELDIICKPFTDQVSSYTSFLALPSLKVMVWSISILIIVLNFMVLFLRSFQNTKHRVLCSYVKLLSVSDSLIGFYMLAIGLLDIRFGKDYHAMALNFSESWLCTGLGMLGVFSKQFSLFIVLLISYDRNRSVTQDFFQLPTIYSLILVMIGFLLSALIALFPVLFWSHSNQNNIYFSANLLCYPLHLAEPFLLGYQFNAVVNIFVNLPIVLIIIFLYAHMYFRIKKSREGTRPIFNLNVSRTNIATASNQTEPQSNSANSFKYILNPSASKLQSNVNLVIKNTNDNQEDRKLALRFFFIVATDCICWLPVIIIKIVALSNYFKIPGLLNAWIIIVILPINCILNPIIYTIVAPKHLSKLLATTYSILKMKLMNLFKLNTTKRSSNVRQGSDSGDFRTSSGSNLNSINQHALNSPLSSSQITMQCFQDRKSSNEQEEKFCESYLDLNNNNNENLMSISQSLIKSSTTNV